MHPPHAQTLESELARTEADKYDGNVDWQIVSSSWKVSAMGVVADNEALKFAQHGLPSHCLLPVHCRCRKKDQEMVWSPNRMLDQGKGRN